MRFLTSHDEHFLSCHKISKHVDAAFSEWKIWMSRGESWEDCLAAVKMDNERRKKKKEKKIRWMARGLYSPTRLLAVMILAHLDAARYKHWIGRLNIDWMLTRRESLDVSHGLWKGLHTANIYTMFSLEEFRTTPTPLSVDYTLLCTGFLASRSNIRPFLEPWAQSISVEREPDLKDLAGVTKGHNGSPKEASTTSTSITVPTDRHEISFRASAQEVLLGDLFHPSNFTPGEL